MNQKKILVVVLLVVACLVGVAVWFASQPESTTANPDSDALGAKFVPETKPVEKKRVARAETSRWKRVGPGTVVGVLREYGSERPIEGAEVTLEAGLPGPNDILQTKTGADGGFTFEKVTNFDAWTFRAKSPSTTLSDTELAGVDVVANRQTSLGTVYLAPAFAVPGIVVDEKDTPIADAKVRAIRARPAAGGLDILRLIRELPSRPAAVDTATSGADGKFALTKTPPGRYDFTIEKPGYQLKVESGAIITPEAKDHPLKFVILRGFQADGVVVRDGGGLAEGLTVVAFAEPGNGRADFSALDKVLATTDEKGAFHLDGLAGGRYVVAVAPEGEPAVMAPNVTIPTKTPIEIHLKGEAWLEGKITGDGDAPVADAQVYALNFDGRSPTIGNVRTDAAGHYVVRGLPAGPLQLFMVQAEGYGNYPDDLTGLMRGRMPADVKLVAGRNEKNVSLAKGGVVRGMVKEQGGDVPIAGARVELGSVLAMFGGSRGVTTGADGKFEITSVPKGAAILMVSKEGWFQPGVNAQSVMMSIGARMQASGATTGKDTGRGATIVVSEPGEVIERTLELARGSTLAGAVSTPDGKPIQGAQVSLVIESDAGGMGRMLAGLFPSPEPRLTDAEGHYQIPGPAPGEKARVVARSAGYLDGKSDVLTCAPGDAKENVDVRLRQGATLSGRVHDPENHAIDGALVRWTSLNEDANEWSVTFRLSRATPTLTDSKGEFTIHNVETGKLAIEASSPRYLSWTSRDVVAEDGKKSEFDVVLKLGAVIEGRVVGVDGKAPAGATVSCILHAEGNDAMRIQDRSNSVAVDAKGTFRAEGLAPGKYDLEARAPGAAPSETVVADAGGPAVTLQLAQAFSITGIVRFSGGGPVADVQVALQKRVSVPAPGGGPAVEQEREVKNVRTGAAGEFELREVPGGTYSLSVSAGWGVMPRPNILAIVMKDVQAGRQGIVVEVESGLNIVGTVVDEDGKPAADGWVWGQPVDAKPGVNEGVNGQIEAGRFELSGMRPGKYRVSVNNGGRQKSVVVEAGSRDVRIELGGGGSIKVHVVNPDQSAAVGARVNASGEAGGGSAVTDADGRCELKALSEGTFAVYANGKFGDAVVSAHQADVQVRPGAATEVELKLEVHAIGPK